MHRAMCSCRGDEGRFRQQCMQCTHAFGAKSGPPLDVHALEAVAQRRLVSAAADARKAVEAVNRERKLAQTAAAASLGDAEERWLAVVAKNREIEAACEALEAHASAIQDSLPQRCGPEACLRQSARCFGRRALEEAVCDALSVHQPQTACRSSILGVAIYSIYRQTTGKQGLLASSLS